MSQKFENILNLAIETEERIREKSKYLNNGYNEADESWQVVIRYAGDISFLEKQGVRITYLISNYAIIDAPVKLLPALSDYEEIIYVEMPKSLYYGVENGKRASCIDKVQSEFGNYNLQGEGVICALIDSGIDIYNDAFIDENGNTRIIKLWDQSIVYNTNENTNGAPANYGRVFDETEINEALNMYRNTGVKDFLSKDISGHGTHVAGIMAGNFAKDKNNNVGIATRSKIIAVKLNNRNNNGFNGTIDLMQAIYYIYKTALELKMPVSINISIGNSFGSHDGNSLLETYIDDISNLWKLCICVGTGNEGARAGHFRGKYVTGDSDRIDFSISEFESDMCLQLWKSYEDEFLFKIYLPGNIISFDVGRVKGKLEYKYQNMIILIYVGEPSPYSIYQNIYIELIANTGYLLNGVWSIYASALKCVSGIIDIWIPDSAFLNSKTEFLRPDPDISLTIPSTASKVISVGGYDQNNGNYAEFSGRGYTRNNNEIKPDIVAPAVNILSADSLGGLSYKSGTSMATPFVTGSAALLMEWGIVKGNDRFLYGEKIKAFLLKGAIPLNANNMIPNRMEGYGRLCLEKSLN